MRNRRLSPLAIGFIIAAILTLIVVAVLVFDQDTRLSGTAANQPTEVPPTEMPPTDVPPTNVPPTNVPPTEIPPTQMPPTDIPPTQVPPTDVPPTDVPPTDVPPTDVPPTDIPPTDVPPTDVPPTDVPPTQVPPTDVPPTDVPPTQVPPTDIPPTQVPPTEIPPTDVPPTQVPPTEIPPTEESAAQPQEQATIEPINAGFSADIREDGSVQFQDTSSGPVTGWIWDFGDGATSDQQSPLHSYMAPGTYNVTLLITNAAGQSSTASSNVTIVEEQAPPLMCGFDMQYTGNQVPLTVNFVNTSENSETFAWNFGDGATSSEASPTHTYQQAGTYTITLTCSNSSETLTANGQLTITQAVQIAAGFSISMTGETAPLTVQFEDTSSGDEIVAWQWDFGDGATSTERAPSHIYTQPGTYTITLTVTGASGQTATANSTVTVAAPVEPVNADFSVSPEQGEAPLTVEIVNLTTGTVETWAWDFGDGTSSTSRDPGTITYNAPGTYTIRMTADGPGGGGTVSKQVLVLEAGTVLEASFEANTVGEFNDETGTQEVCFTDTSTGIVAERTWTFPDGSTSSEAAPCITLGEGNHAVTLSVRGEGGESSTTTQVVSVVRPVDPPQAAFSSNRTTITEGNSVNFDDRSTGLITDWLWDFGDGATSSDRNPSHRYETPGSYIVTLTVTGPGGSSQASDRTITVNEEVVQLSCSIGGGGWVFTGEEYSYDGRVSGAGDQALTYRWTLDGVEIGTTEDITVTFTEENRRLVFEATAADGQTCASTRWLTVRAGESGAFANFGRSPSRGPGPLQVCFNNRSYGSIAGYVWDFGDGATSTEENPCHTYTGVGRYRPTLTVTGTDGRTHSRSGNVNVYEAQSLNAIASPASGVAPLQVTLTAESTGLREGDFEWTLPGGVKAFSRTTSYLFTQPGEYTVTVTGRGPLGRMSADVVVVVGQSSNIRAAFTPSRWGGVGPLEVCFTDNSAGDELTTWAWNFGNGQTSSEQNPCVTFADPGNYSVSLAVTNRYGLTATATNTISVYELIEDRSSWQVTSQNGLTVCFVGDADEGTEIISWNFGDGNTGTGENPCHTYAEAGNYEVSMIIRNAQGTGAIVRTITVNNIPTPEPTDTPADGSEPTPTDEITPDPTPTDEVPPDDGSSDDETPTEEPTPTDEITPDPTPTDEVTPDDGSSDDETPTEEPTPTEEITPDPTPTDEVTPDPTLPTMTMPPSDETPVPMTPISTNTPDDSTQPEVTPETPSNGTPDEPTISVPQATPEVTPNSTPNDTTTSEVTPDSTPEPDLTTTPEDSTAVAQAQPGDAMMGQVCEYRCVDWQIHHSNRSGNWEIYRLGAVPGTEINLSQGEGADDMAPSRSPDAEWVVFTSNRDSTPDAENWELYIAAADGSSVRRVTYNTIANDTDPVWGPGNAIVYETTRDGNWELYLLDVTTGSEQRLTNDTANDINASWSADGSQIVFQSDRSGTWQLYRLDVATLTTTRLSDGTGTDLEPVYSPDGSRIAFRSYRDDSSVIYTMDAQGGDLQAISNAAGEATNHVWSPDGSLLAYQSDLDGDLDVYIYAVGSTQTRQLTNNTIADYAPTWRCSSTQVIFTSEVPGNPDIFEANALPIIEPSIFVELDAQQRTDDPLADIYPEGAPVEENASQEGYWPTAGGTISLGTQTDFLRPDMSVTTADPSVEAIFNDDFLPPTCPAN